MSYSCGPHGWRHGNKECPQCLAADAKQWANPTPPAGEEEILSCAPTDKWGWALLMKIDGREMVSRQEAESNFDAFLEGQDERCSDLESQLRAATSQINVLVADYKRLGEVAESFRLSWNDAAAERDAAQARITELEKDNRTLAINGNNDEARCVEIGMIQEELIDSKAREQRLLEAFEGLVKVLEGARERAVAERELRDMDCYAAARTWAQAALEKAKGEK